MAKKSTKKALLVSALSLTLSASMFVGTTFAWFTDSVESGVNQIVSGNLDVELTHKGAGDDAFVAVKDATNLFENAEGKPMLWEPGASSSETFKVSNEGSLALKYTFEMNYDNATKTPSGKTLADVLTATIETPDGQTSKAALANFTYDSTLVAGASEEFTVTIAWEQSANDNEFNVKGGLKIDLGVKVFATQYTFEYDGNGNDYDENAPYFTVEVTPETAQDYLDGKYGSLEYATVVFKAGNYDKLYLARPTKYAGSNTTYICPNGNSHTDEKVTFETSEEFIAHFGEREWHATPRYETKFQNVTFTAENGANIAGFELTTGHCIGNVYDYVRDIQYTSGSAYYSAASVKNVTFDGIAFTGTADFTISDDVTKVSDVTFKNCSFTTGGTASANGAALRYYSESETRNDQAINLTVENCTFNNVYQGVYAHHVNGLTVTGSTFDTTGHNAIAIQSHGNVPFDHGNIVIQKNTFNNIGDRVIRMNNVGANTTFAISLNKATNSGDEDGEVMKATALADGITYDIHTNNWGTGAIVANAALADDYTGVTSETTASAFKNVQSGDTVIIADDLDFAAALKESTSIPQSISVGAGSTIDFAGHTMERKDGNGNGINVSTTELVTFKNAVFSSASGQTFFDIRRAGANVKFVNCVFKAEIDSNGNDAIRAFANNATLTFENCTFENMFIDTNSSYKDGFALQFNNCTFNWNGVNCPGFVKLANSVQVDIDFTDCNFSYSAAKSKAIVEANRLVGATTVDFNGVNTMTGVGNEGSVWTMVRKANNITATNNGTINYTHNGVAVNVDNYLFA